MDNYGPKTEDSYQAIKLSSYQAIRDERENQIIVSLTRKLEISQKYSFC